VTRNTSDGRKLADEVAASGAAPDIAGTAALLEIGESLGLIDILRGSTSFTADLLAEEAGLPAAGVRSYLEALLNAGVIEFGGDGLTYTKAADFDVILHRAGYVSWAMVANRPFVEHARAFLLDPEAARGQFLRDGRQVAVSSEWMGSLAFYPAAIEEIYAATPRRIADLGSGTCRLLINVLREFPDSHAVGLDIDEAACAAARDAAKAAGVDRRLTVFERPIQSVAEDPSPIEGADVVHAGFVFHDMLPEEETIADRVLASCYEVMPAGSLMAITDAIPYADSQRERAFSAIVTYYHQTFMGRRLLSEKEWEDKLRAAGFRHVRTVELGFPTGRLFKATK
jgi:SAM-dependent methyltransferase